MKANDFLTDGISLEFDSILLEDTDINDYVKQFVEVYDIDKHYLSSLTNIRKLSNPGLFESAEYSEILPFINLIGKLDTADKVKVGDQFAVLAFEIIFAWKDINVFGFTSPKQVADVKMNANGKINYILFTDGDRYPRLTPATYNGKPIIQTAYFKQRSSAETALTALMLTLPQDWDLDTNGLNKE
jgi:hypothetical protein